MATEPRQLTTKTFLTELGVRSLPRLTSPFDPGYDPVTVEAHLAQSGHLMSRLKLSMATWMVASVESTKRKIAAAAAAGVPVVTGGGPFEIAADSGHLESYLELCASLGIDRIEAGRGFTKQAHEPEHVVTMARCRGLEVQFELGRKHDDEFTDATISSLVDEGRRWLDAGAVEIVIEARESAAGVGLFARDGQLNTGLAERLADGLGLGRVCFEAPTKSSQFALLDHFGSGVSLSNVRLEEVLRVEIYRRGLHSDAYSRPHLRPGSPAEDRP